jgi:hypothetical protein
MTPCASFQLNNEDLYKCISQTKAASPLCPQITTPHGRMGVAVVININVVESTSD